VFEGGVGKGVGDGRETARERGRGGRRQDLELERREVNGLREPSVPVRMAGDIREFAGRAGR
jgi:hypothetical protein